LTEDLLINEAYHQKVLVKQEKIPKLLN